MQRTIHLGFSHKASKRQIQYFWGAIHGSNAPLLKLVMFVVFMYLGGFYLILEA